MSRFKVYEIKYSKYGDTIRGIFSRDYLKAKCINMLENNNYADKSSVDLRSVDSMVRYIFRDVQLFRALN